MMRKLRNRNSHLFLNLADHFESCRTFLIVFCGSVLVGVLIGCFSFAKYNKIFELSTIKLFDSNVFFSKVNFFSYACKNFFKYFFLILIIIVGSLNVYILPLNVLSLGYLGYIVGANVTLMIIVLGFTGTILIILLYLPLSLLICFLIINFACVCEKNCFDNHKYGKFSCKGRNVFPFTLLLSCIMLICIFIILLIEGLILPTSIKNILLKI